MNLEYTEEQDDLYEELNDLTAQARYGWGMTPREIAKVVQDHTDLLLGFLCLDCDVDTGSIGHYYMVKDDVWKQANPGGDGMLCLSCLSTRLERPISPGDFKEIPMNEGHIKQYGLAA